MKTSCLLLFSYILTILNWTPVHAVDLPLGSLACAAISFFIGHPEPLDEIRPKYFLYTRSNNETYKKLDFRKPKSITDSHFNPEDETLFIIHGWRGDVRRPGEFSNVFKDRFLKKDNYNVIVVDNHRALQSINYFQVVNNNKLSAGVTADLIRALMKLRNLKLSKLHIIGHSLGGQHAGYVGHLVPGIRRISAMDPAGWCFESKALDERLDKTDALFVDVIHSSVKMFFATGGIGYDDDVGHVDFYPNGGGNIPGCAPVTIVTALTGIFDLWQAFQTKHVCCHVMAVKYYYESMDSDCKFVAQTCTKTYKKIFGFITYGKPTITCDCGNKECNEMGYPASPLKNLGHQELETNDKYPFCKRPKSDKEHKHDKDDKHDEHDKHKH